MQCTLLHCDCNTAQQHSAMVQICPSLGLFVVSHPVIPSLSGKGSLVGPLFSQEDKKKKKGLKCVLPNNGLSLFFNITAFVRSRV